MTKDVSLNCSAIIALAVAAIAVPAAGAGIPAGSLIENTASATYTNDVGPLTIDSNTVTLLVDELLDVATASQESGAVSASTTATLHYKVTNTGNGSEAFTLTANPAVTGNAFNATVTGLAIDVNGNGIYDPGVDTALTNGAASAALAPDAAIDVLVMVSIPVSAADGATSKVELSAAAVTGTGAPGTVFGGSGSNGGDAVVGASGALASAQASLIVGKAGVTLTKSATTADPFGGTRPVPSATITYRIVADVTGTGTVTGLNITDAIPTGTTYQPGTLTLEGAALTDAADGDAGQASATSVAVQLGTLGAGAQRTVTFQVKIN